MSVNTHAMIPAAPKSGKPADGAAGDRGQSNARDAAAAFQSVLSGMKGGDTAVDGAGDNRRGQGNRHAGQGEPSSETAGDQGGGKSEEAAGKTAPAAAFSTSNLVDALRRVSHAVLSQGHAKDDSAADPAATAQEMQSVAERPGAGSLLPLSAVIAHKPGQVPQATQAQNQAPVQAGLAGSLPQDPAGREGTARTGTSSLFAQFGVEPEKVSGALTGGDSRSRLPEEAAGTVKVLRQETHFAPNLRLSPAQQVGDQVATALKALASDQSQAGVTHKAEGPVLKTLDIQLTPHELGTVKVSLRMVGDTVEVTLQTSQAQTAELLKQDRQLLDQMLRTTGFKADAITIQAADDRGAVQAGSSANGNASANQNAPGNGTFADGQSQQSGNGSAGQNQGRPDRNQRDGVFQFSEQTRGEGHEEAPGNSLSDGIYL